MKKRSISYKLMLIVENKNEHGVMYNIIPKIFYKRFKNKVYLNSNGQLELIGTFTPYMVESIVDAMNLVDDFIKSLEATIKTDLVEGVLLYKDFTFVDTCINDKKLVGIFDPAIHKWLTKELLFSKYPTYQHTNVMEAILLTELLALKVNNQDSFLDTFL